MISLNVAKYCDNCPDFTPNTEMVGYYSDEGKPKTVDTEEFCKFRDRCAGIARMMEDRENERERKEAGV